MQLTDTGSKLQHQHIRASTAEGISGFLQCCKKSRICSVFPRGFTLLLEKQPKPKPPELAEGPVTWRRESNDQFWQNHMADTAY